MATAQVSAETIYNDIRMAAETIRNDEPATIPIMSVGDVCRQGDLYILAIDGPLPGTPTAVTQLAPGTTQGSRHVAEGDCSIFVVDAAVANAAIARVSPAAKSHTHFTGPYIQARGAVTITHPEHGHRTIPPGDYLVVYQSAWADVARRQAD